MNYPTVAQETALLQRRTGANVELARRVAVVAHHAPLEQIEPLPDIDDPIPLVRLRMPGPVTRITLTWQDP